VAHLSGRLARQRQPTNTRCCLQGFAERKVLFLHSLIQVAKERHNAEVRRQRLAAAAPSRVRALRHPQRTHPQRAPSLSLRDIA